MLGRIAGAADRMTFLLDAQRALALAEDPGVGGEALLSDVATDVDVAQDGVVPLPQDALRLVLDHLIGNARAHGATKITVSFDGTLTVQDNVPGVSEGHRTKIFEPFSHRAAPVKALEWDCRLCAASLRPTMLKLPLSHPTLVRGS